MEIPYDEPFDQVKGSRRSQIDAKVLLNILDENQDGFE